MIKCKVDWFASKEQPCKVFGPSEKQCRPQNLRYFLQKDRGLLERDCPRNGWWGERVEKKLCERLGTSLDLNPEVGKKRRKVPRSRFHDRLREIRTASREALSRFLNL